VFGGKYMEFRIIFSLQYSIRRINTFEVDPPSDSLHNAVVKPKNTGIILRTKAKHYRAADGGQPAVIRVGKLVFLELKDVVQFSTDIQLDRLTNLRTNNISF
jgi:hypothetical protein